MHVLTMMEASKRDSVIHRLNPLSKIIFCACMIAAPIMSLNPFVAIIELAIIWLLAIPAKITDLFYPTMLKLYPVMLLFLLIIWPLFYHHPGEHDIVHWGFLWITWEGIYFAVAQALRIAVAITGCCYFIMVAEIIDLSSVLGRGLQKIGISYTLPFMITTAFKFLPESLSTFSTISESFKARAFQLDKGSFVQRLKNYIPLFIPLIDTSLGKSQNLASAMILRAYGSKKKRTFYVEYGFTFGDVLFILLSLAMLGFAIWGKIVKLGGFNLTIH